MNLDPQTLIPIISISIALVFILLRNRAPRPLHVRWMWVMPVILVAFIGYGIWAMNTYTPHEPFTPLALAGMGAALLAGAALGWWRGKTIDIHRDARSGLLMAKASPAGLIFIFALLAVRYATKGVLEANAQAWHINLAALTDGFLLFTAGLLVVSRIEMWIRARAITGTGRDPAAA